MFDDDIDIRRSSSSDCLSYQSIPDADREMAAQALHEFEQQHYEQSYVYLKKLFSKRPQDSKVFHNCGVVEFYLSKCKKTEHFNKKMLDAVKLSHVDVQDLESLDDVDNCVVLYNQSVILYHLHQYHSAICILDKVFQFIEPLEESLARNVCFLLLESYISVSQPKKALCLIGYMESMLTAGNRNCSNKSNQKDVQKEEGSESGMTDAWRRKLQLCKARCYAMIKTSKACKREIKNLMSSASQLHNIPAFYLKSQLEYQRGNYRKALKLLNSITLPDDISKYFQETGDCLPAIFYNNVGCIHFYMGKPNLGQFYTERALKEFEGVLQVHTESTEHKLNVRPLHLMSVSTRHQLLYNLGMQFLQAKKFKRAYDCFTEVVPSYHFNPRLWLRIAECCIHLHHPDCVEELVEFKGRPFVKSVAGGGSHRKIIMNAVLGDGNSTTPEPPSLHYAMICLKNALFLVGDTNSNTIVGDCMSHIQTSADEPDASTSEETILPVLPANFLQGPEIQSLRNSILVASSYVALCLGDVVLAHDHATALLAQPRISSAHKFLAHLYAGEALLIMDKITESVEHLNFQSSNEIELAFSVSSSEISLKHQTRFDSKMCEKIDDGSRPVGNIPNWMPNTISSAKFVAQYNLAVAYAVREEWTKALDCLLQMNPSGNVPPQALSLLVYVQSHQGSVEDTKTYVEQLQITNS